MKKSMFTVKFKVSVPMFILWIAAFWMFVSLMVAIIISNTGNALTYNMFSKNRSNSDRGAIIVLATWIVPLIAIWAKNRSGKYVIGSIDIVFGLLILIGSLIAEPNPFWKTLLAWTIPSITFLFVGLFWILDASNVFQNKNKVQKVVPNKEITH